MISLFDELPENAVAVTEWTPKALLAIGIALTGIAYFAYFCKTNPRKD